MDLSSLDVIMCDTKIKIEANILKPSKIESVNLVLRIVFIFLLKGRCISRLALFRGRVILTLVLCTLQLQLHSIARETQLWFPFGL